MSLFSLSMSVSDSNRFYLHRNLIVLVFLVFGSITVNAQNALMDSLYRDLNKYHQIKKPTYSNDTSAVNTYIELAFQNSKTAPDTALYFGKEGYKLAMKAKWSFGTAKSIHRIGSIYQSKYDFNSAIENFRNALPFIENCSTKPCKLLRARIFSDMGTIYRNIGKAQDAITVLEQAVAIYKEQGDKKGIIFQCNSMGQAYLDQSKYAKAKASFEQGLEIAESMNDTLRSAILIGNIGLAQNGLDQFQEAIRSYETALAMDIAIKNPSGQLRHLANLASVYRKLGNLDQSMKYAKQSLRISEEINNKMGIANSLGSMAVVTNIMGNYQLSAEYNTRALAIYVELNSLSSQANTLGNLALDYQYLGNAPLALEYHLKSLRLNEQLGRAIENSFVLTNIGLIYQDNGNYKTALEYHLRALEYANEKNSGEAKVYIIGNMGNSYLRMDNFEEAEACYMKAKSLCRELGMKGNEAHNLGCLGTLFYYQKDFKKSIQYNQEALSIYNELGFLPNTITSFSTISNCYYEMDSIPQAIEYGRKAMKVSANISTPEKMRLASRSLYSAFVKINQADSAMRYLSVLREMVNKELETSYFTLTEKERESFFASIEEDFHNYYDFASSHQKKLPELADTMFNMVLTNKGLSLRSTTFLRQSILSSRDTSLIRKYNQLIQLKTLISSRYSSGESAKELEEQVDQLERDLISSSGAFGAFDKIRKIDWKQVRASLKKGECAIEFVHFQSRITPGRPVLYAALIVRPDSEHPEIVKLCTEKELGEALGVQRGNNVTYVEALYGKRKNSRTDLYKKIWAPLEGHLKGIKTIYFSPSGLLHKISFSALSKDNSVFLSDAYNLKQKTSSGRLVIGDNVKYEEKDQFLLVGGVQYTANNTENEIWKYLPGTATETSTIVSLLDRYKIGYTYLSSAKATEENLKKNVSDASIVHISTHGFFFPSPDEQQSAVITQTVMKEDVVFRGATEYANLNFVSNRNPLMRSGLVFAGANDVWDRDPMLQGEDGILTAQEVSNLDLRKAKLVVLSACETGLGDIKGTEGVYGLQRAIKMAGGKHLIISLWQVPDQETSEFMLLFYKNLLKLKDVHTAFQKTQKVMREKYDPYYWAAFVLID